MEKKLHTIEYDPVHAWCSFWPEGITRFPVLWTDVCKIHDIMGWLTELDDECGVSLYGQVYTWENMGFDEPLTQEEQDAWLLNAIMSIAENDTRLTYAEREEVRMNACTMYMGLRTVGRVYRAVV